MELLNIIKGTALNKGRARTWIESEKIASYGFARGERINITFEADKILVVLDPMGKRKVAGREKGGRTICILDICYPVEQREAMFKGAAKLALMIEHGRIEVRTI